MVAAPDDTSVIEARLVDVDKQLNRLLDLYQLGSIDKNNLSTRVGDLNREKSALLDQMIEPEDSGPRLAPGDAETLLMSAREILTGDDPIKKRELVHSLIDRIELVDEDVLIHWAFV